MKKQISAILCICMLAATFLPNIFAAAAEPEDTDFGFAVIEDETRGRRAGTLVENQRILNADNENGAVLRSERTATNHTSAQELRIMESQTLIEYFRMETENFQEEIDISQYNIRYDEDTDTVDICGGISYGEFYEMLVYCSPRSYYLISGNGTFDYFYPFTKDGIIQYIYPIYSYFKNDPFYDENFWINQDRLNELLPEIYENMSAFDAGIIEIEAIADEDDSDFEKLVKYHDYMVMNYSYDWDCYEQPFDERMNNTALRLITTKKGLCESIAVLYNYLMMNMGLETGFVTSYDSYSGYAYHTWNMVKVAVPECGVPNKDWFHIDITWDENAMEYVSENGTREKNEGRTVFDSFLVSDDETWRTHGPDSVEGVYYDKNCGAANTALDNAPWRRAMSQLAVSNGMLYYFIDNNGTAELHRTNAADSSEVVESFNGNWAISGSYPGLVLNDNTIYYNTSNQICSYDIVSGTITKTDISLAENQQIFGLYRDENGLGYCTAELTGAGTASPFIMNGKVSLECTISTPILSGSTVTIPISAELNKAFFVVVKNGDTFKTVTTETNSDIIIDNINENGITVYVWNNNMKPYTAAVEL